MKMKNARYAVTAAAIFLFLLPALLFAARAEDDPATETLHFAVLTPVPTSAATAAPVPVPTPVPTPTPVPVPFSLIFMPDTQAMAYHDTPLIDKTGKSVMEHVRNDNAIAILHAGDMVDNGFKEWQWVNFYRLLDMISGKVPFCPVAGNHDMGQAMQKYDPFQAHADKLLRDVPEEARFEGGIIYYKVLEAGNEKLLLIGASYDTLRTEEAYRFLDGVMEKYGDLPCILLTHSFLTPEQKGAVLHHSYLEADNVIKKYPNVRMVFCGHMDGHVTTELHFDDDGDGVKERTVHAMMLNYGTANYYAFRVLTFDPLSRSVDVKTYSADPKAAVRCTRPKKFGPIDFTWEDAF